MTKKQHLENIRIVCGSKSRIEVFEWLKEVARKWNYECEGNENRINFLQAFYDYLSKDRKEFQN